MGPALRRLLLDLVSPLSLYGRVCLPPSRSHALRSNLPLQVVTFLCYVGFRAYLYSVITDFMARTFGPKTVGRVCGLVYVVAALVGLLQYPLVIMTNTTFNGTFACVLLVFTCVLYVFMCV